MRTPFLAFSALYLATLLMLIGTSLFNTYVALYLSDLGASSTKIGAMIAFYYAGMVVGSKFGNNMISNFGHIRTYVASAGISTIIVLLHIIIKQTDLWLALRFLMGLAMMCQYMVLESWLNEQADTKQRGIVFAAYMIAINIGQLIGQLLLVYFPGFDHTPLIVVAIAFAGSLIPVALTRRMHPAQLIAVPLELRFFLERVPQSLVTVFIAGVMSGSFYGLAPIYGDATGLSVSQVSIFISVAMAAGFVAQWPIGWISDRMDRARLIQINAVAMAILGVPMWGFFDASFMMLLTFSFLLGIYLFTFYPLGVAFANDNVEQSKRVALSGLLLVVFGVGASLGPILTGLAMKGYPHVLFIMFSVMSIGLAFWVHPSKHSDIAMSPTDSPSQFLPMTEHPVGAVMIDPRANTSDVLQEHIVEIKNNIGPREPTETSSEKSE